MFCDPRVSRTLDCLVWCCSSEKDEQRKKISLASKFLGVRLHFRSSFLWEVILFCKNSLKSSPYPFHMHIFLNRKSWQKQLDLGTFTYLPATCVIMFCLCTFARVLSACRPRPHPLCIHLAKCFSSQPGLLLLGNLSWTLKVFVIWIAVTLYIYRPFWSFSHRSTWHIVSAHRYLWMRLFICVLSPIEVCRLLLHLIFVPLSRWPVSWVGLVLCPFAVESEVRTG